MNELISHIEFLLHTHNCVIVPGLGGFVVNTASVRKEGLFAFHPPVSELVFNGDLTHNDGLLVESFMRIGEISFEAATQRIEAAVREIKTALRDEKRVALGSLGHFETPDGQRFTYLPSPFVRPQHFGLSTASFKPVIQIQPKTLAAPAEPTARPVMRKIGIGAAAAAVIAAIMLVFPVQDNPLHRQTAQIFPEDGLFAPKTEKAEPIVSEQQVEPEPVMQEARPAIQETGTLAEPSPASAEEKPAPGSNRHRYYIVAGVYHVRQSANEMIARLHSEGFTDAATLERPGRIDVYALSFASYQEASQSLKQFKQDFPNHRDAWILRRR